jgi:hypothetical protein
MLLFAVGIVLPFVLGIVLLPFELALLAVLAGGDRLLKAARLRPWTWRWRSSSSAAGSRSRAAV